MKNIEIELENENDGRSVFQEYDYEDRKKAMK